MPSHEAKRLLQERWHHRNDWKLLAQQISELQEMFGFYSLIQRRL
jgi:hypothetical protein